METNNRENKIKKTFDVLDTIEEAKISPFFKDKVMQQLFSKKEQKQKLWSWFTPQLQFATLVCFIVLNSLALTQLETVVTTTTELDEFAQTYELFETEESVIFY